MKLKFKLPKDFGATYQREVAGKAGNKAKFYLIAAVIAVILFLVFGIRPLALTTAENRKLLLQLKEIEQKLEEKNQKIDYSSKELDRLSEQIEILYKRIPNEDLLEEYLEELVLSAARSGFVIQRFRQQDTAKEGIPIEVELTGNITSLPQMVAKIEANPRFTIVRDVRTNIEDNFTNVRLVVLIFAL